jgi:hypothetical protein
VLGSAGNKITNKPTAPTTRPEAEHRRLLTPGSGAPSRLFRVALVVASAAS